MREGCDEGCVPEALLSNKDDSFSLNHIGVLIAGLAGGALGDLLRCSPWARDWMVSAGYPPTEFSRLITARAPAVFDLLAMIVLAYVMTWLMRHVQLRGISGGVEVAVLVWLAVFCLSIPEVVFFFPVKIFAMSALLKLVTLLMEGILLGVFVVPHEHEATATTRTV